jgi:hypothetical protein
LLFLLLELLELGLGFGFLLFEKLILGFLLCGAVVV